MGPCIGSAESEPLDHQGRFPKFISYFYFRCCLADYAKLRVAMDKLAERMMRTDRVHIVGPGTDLTFSIKGMPAIPCSGDFNIPDGEVFTAPILDSVNGTVTYTAPTVYQGIPFDGICLTFKNGKIVEAHCNGNDEALNKILDSDKNLLSSSFLSVLILL